MSRGNPVFCKLFSKGSCGSGQESPHPEPKEVRCLLLPPQQQGQEEPPRQQDGDRGPCGGAHIVRQQQTADPADQSAEDRDQMILSQVPGDVPRSRSGEHQQGVDHQQAHPAHGDSDHYGDGGGKQEVLPHHPDPPAVRQGLVDGGEDHMVEGGDPQDQKQDQDHRQKPDLPGGHAENVANEQSVEPGEALPSQCTEKNAQSHRRRGEDADGCVAGHLRPLSNQGEQQGDDDGENHCRPHGLSQAAECSDGDAGEGGVPQSVGEEGHPALHHHGGQETEEGRDDQHPQQGVLHEKHRPRLGPLEGQDRHQRIPQIHSAVPPSSRFRWKTDWNSGDPRTSLGVPCRRIVCWSRITLSA